MRRFPRFPLFIVAAVLAALSIALLAGCGSSNSSAQSDNAATVTTRGIESEPALPAPAADPNQPVPDEQAAPYGLGSQYSQSVGTLIDGLKLKDVRWSDHGTYFRVVFDMATSDGQPVLQVPHAETSMTNGNQQIRVVLGGIRSIGDAANAQATDLQVGDSMVASINRLQEADDQALVYAINLKKPGSYSLAGIGSPGRVVIDVTK